jgi:hypothetical protein
MYATELTHAFALEIERQHATTTSDDSRSGEHLQDL